MTRASGPLVAGIWIFPLRTRGMLSSPLLRRIGCNPAAADVTHTSPATSPARMVARYTTRLADRGSEGLGDLLALEHDRDRAAERLAAGRSRNRPGALRDLVRDAVNAGGEPRATGLGGAVDGSALEDCAGVVAHDRHLHAERAAGPRPAGGGLDVVGVETMAEVRRRVDVRVREVQVPGRVERNP